MEIKTKYNVGDTLYTIEHFKIIKFEVARICIFTYENGVNIFYSSKNYIDYNENECFQTEDELINQLKNK